MTYCENCQKEVSEQPEDHGFGRGEFWGQPYNHQDWRMVCPECGEELELSYHEWKFEQECSRADWEYDQWKERQWEKENSK